VLGWPADAFVVESLGTAKPTQPGKVANVQILGTDERMKWKQKADGLRVELPKQFGPTTNYATALKISMA
jgi:alpha-L-fucosidase